MGGGGGMVAWGCKERVGVHIKRGGWDNVVGPDGWESELSDGSCTGPSEL